MAEGTYVKLTKDQNSLQEINPGELNQPIDVARVNARKCPECGQPLPQSYEPPADEDWATGICGCAEDPESCLTGLFCPCVLFGRNVETLQEEISEKGACVCHVIFVEGGMALAAITALASGIDPDTTLLIVEGLLFAWWGCGIYTSMARQSLQRKYHLKDSPCDPCMVHCCMHWCALCQEHREMRSRLAEDHRDSTIVDPPPVQEMNAMSKPVQEMNASSEQQSASSSSSVNDANNRLALQPV
ncbi:cell number regulator 6-like [Apium graveolens]|uniref:cell number regulator 6-like n=1 Tax=Apium graveolens TaxID=4045 RepID=UPI003D7BB03E